MADRVGRVHRGYIGIRYELLLVAGTAFLKVHLEGNTIIFTVVGRA